MKEGIFTHILLFSTLKYDEPMNDNTKTMFSWTLIYVLQDMNKGKWSIHINYAFWFVVFIMFRQKTGKCKIIIKIHRYKIGENMEGIFFDW